MKKDLLIIGFVVLVLVVLLTGTDIQSVDEYYLTHIDDITPESETVSLEIRCDTVLDNWDSLDPALRDANYIPIDGVYLPPTEYVLRADDTVFDLLDRAARAGHLQMEYQGADVNVYNTVYIRGIGHLYEFSCGPLSGWTFMVNGASPGVGCSRFKLRNGDSVQWLYTCDLGRDVGSNWQEKAPQG